MLEALRVEPSENSKMSCERERQTQISVVMNPNESTASTWKDSSQTECLAPKIEIELVGTEMKLSDEDSPPFCLDEEERRKRPMVQREKDIEGTIEWLKRQIKCLKEQDQNLMRQFLKLRGLINSVKSLPPMGRKVSLPEDAIAAYSLRRLSDTSDQLSPGYDSRRRSQSVFGERLMSFSSITSESSMEELSEG